MENRYANKFASFRDHWNYDDVSEDCLRNQRLHAGAQGRQEAPGAGLDPRRRLHQRQRHRAGRYNGENFARFGDAVFCR